MCRLDETPAEQLHSLLQHVHAGALRAKPALVCATVRYPTVRTLLHESHGFLVFLKQTAAGKLWYHLTKNAFGTPRPSRPRSELLGAIYGYNLRELHPDAKERERSYQRWDHLDKDNQAIVPVVPRSARLLPNGSGHASMRQWVRCSPSLRKSSS